MRVRIAIVAAIILLMCQAVFAYDLPVKVKLNDDYFHTDTELVTVNGRIYVPMRPFAEAFGAEITWQDERQAAQLMTKDIIMMLGDNINYTVNFNGKTELETGAILNEKVLYVALQPFVEAFGAQVAWDDQKNTVLVTREGAKLGQEWIEVPKYTEQDVLTLARLVSVESKGGSMNRSLAVANVVLNRVKSSFFPNTLREVVYQRGQFPPTQSASFNQLIPDATCMQAARLALEGVNNIGDCLYFNHKPFRWKSKSDLVKVIEGMYFYR